MCSIYQQLTFINRVPQDEQVKFLPAVSQPHSSRWFPGVSC